MKKFVIVIGVCMLLVSMSVTIHAFPQRIVNQKPESSSLYRSSSESDIPDWANGNFSGVWGINILGIPLEAAGWVNGYYSSMTIGRFEGEFADNNQTNATGFISGLMLGPFIIGKINSTNLDNEILFVALAMHNETAFYWRLMGIIGPTFYIWCEYTKFE